ncbi:MAG TPA: hypothetical protein DCR43_08115 [Bacteroidales bacterium]|nr:MAG: hypothetical protein A2X11_15245 [Bacteroidetes bacterium GWE2_42_24]OFY31698.1 MAG: hypothetical protein A2X09_08990 [Bacteroidetes bacterium GWF2_43_11]HAQ65799.1 hypothetical protein [Bacteroidales bacterium]HBZ67036.1 hypothetical protein [Bacteroidales bacterium]
MKNGFKSIHMTTEGINFFFTFFKIGLSRKTDNQCGYFVTNIFQIQFDCPDMYSGKVLIHPFSKRT